MLHILATGSLVCGRDALRSRLCHTPLAEQILALGSTMNVAKMRFTKTLQGPIAATSSQALVFINIICRNAERWHAKELLEHRRRRGTRIRRVLVTAAA